MNLETLANKLLSLRTQKDELINQTKQITDHIKTLEREIMDLLSAQGLKTGTTPAARLTIIENEIAQLDDWDAICNWIRETDSFYLLHKRISSTKVLELANVLGQDIPGTSKIKVQSLSVTKR